MNFNLLLTALPAVVTGKIGDGYTWGEALMLAASGIAIVFIMLELLVIVIRLFSKIMDSATSNKNEPKGGNQKPKDSVGLKPQSTKSNTTECSTEIVAAIAAAVDYMYSGKKVRPVIRSIKPVNSGRSPWATAGILDNTKPF